LFFSLLLAVGRLASGSGKSQVGTAPKFTSLSSEDSAPLDQQRAVVATVIKRLHGLARTRSAKDLPCFERRLDESVFNQAQTYELLSPGVAFADGFASALPLHGGMITDECGTDPTLPCKNKHERKYPDHDSKRVEQGRKVSLNELVDFTRDDPASLEGNPVKRTWMNRSYRFTM
jgi:hypothetical protein